MNVSAPIPYVKMNGLGNEIVVVDLRGSGRSLDAAQARAIAEAERSRCDQVMVLSEPKTKGTEAFVTIYNSDGSESSACGNGMRCIGLLAARKSGRMSMHFETKAGILDVAVRNGGHVTVDMGAPSFAWNAIPLAERFDDTRAIELQIGPIDKPVLHSPSVVNVGNPHAIFWVDDVEAYDLGRFGPLLENHPLFPERANISLAHVTARDAVLVRTWERGAGLTRACGSAACAVAVAAARKGFVDRKVTVTLPGGALVIEWTPNDRILMTGPAELEFEDRFAPEFASGLAP
jgi:diaminopimelate epimerase